MMANGKTSRPALAVRSSCLIDNIVGVAQWARTAIAQISTRVQCNTYFPECSGCGVHWVMDLSLGLCMHLI